MALDKRLQGLDLDPDTRRVINAYLGSIMGRQVVAAMKLEGR